MKQLLICLAAALLAAPAMAGVHSEIREGAREVRQAKVDGAREVMAERREAARDYYNADNAWERRQAIREGAREVRAAKRKAEREVRSERREARREIRREIVKSRWD
ncbi:hypothetical protein [Chitinilyticum litopenaei]|uniref:hypothetical protein n=1 Tax=Chitinilyticum litopenaei TaxID=1121276 RepID=UPI0004244EF2|nr:hypothetical protein [Chitinilyticum litopenaei]